MRIGRRVARAEFAVVREALEAGSNCHELLLSVRSLVINEEHISSCKALRRKWNSLELFHLSIKSRHVMYIAHNSCAPKNKLEREREVIAWNKRIKRSRHGLLSLASLAR